MPSVITLGTVALLIAAKMNESISPNFKNMFMLIDHMQPGSLKFEDLISLERHIIKTLDFDLQFECSMTFLERFC